MYSSIEEVMDHIQGLLETNKTSLGLGYIGYGDERLIPAYPAVVIDSGPVLRNLHATHTFQLTFNLILWVYHADLTLTYQKRTQADLELVTAVTALLHSNFTLGGNIIFGFVDSATPGMFQRPKGDMVVGTRMTWEGRVQERFS